MLLKLSLRLGVSYTTLRLACPLDFLVRVSRRVEKAPGQVGRHTYKNYVILAAIFVLFKFSNVRHHRMSKILPYSDFTSNLAMESK